MPPHHSSLAAGLMAEDSVPVCKELSWGPIKPGAGDQLFLAVAERWGALGQVIILWNCKTPAACSGAQHAGMNGWDSKAMSTDQKLSAPW